MNRRLVIGWVATVFIAFSLLTPFGLGKSSVAAQSLHREKPAEATLYMAEGTEAKKLIFDEAGLLTSEQTAELNELANKLGAKRETDFIILTTNNPDDEDVMVIMQNFYDEKAPGFDRAHGNAAILTVDMRNREIYLAGFYKAEHYLDDGRLDKIRDRIIPHMTQGNYYTAFSMFIETAYKYMGVRPGVDPDNLLFQTEFQLGVSLFIGLVVVISMANLSGGRVTVNRGTYEDRKTSGILKQHDRHIRTTVTKRKIPKNNGSGGSGGFGGGGITRGGHSHSGSRGSF